MKRRIKKITPIQRFWLLLKPDSRDIRNVYVYSIFNGLVNLSLPLGIQAIVNLIQGGQVSTSWIVLVSFVVAGVAISGAMNIFQLRITENLQQKIFARAAFEFADRIPRIKMEALYKHYPPELMNRFFDVMHVQKGLSKILIDFSSAALQVIFGLILLSLYHPFFILFSLILVTLVYAIFRFTVKRGLSTSLEESKHKYKLVHWLEEVARTSTTFKLAGKSDLPLRRTDKHVSDYVNAREGHFSVLVRQYYLLVGFKVIIATGLLAIGGILVMEQHMNIGQFVAAEIIILLIMGSVEKLILSLETIYDVLTSLEKVGQVTDLELEEYDNASINPDRIESGVEVELKNVSFTYPDHDRKTLNNLNLTIQGGERLFLTGSNGSGKSTLLYITSALYNVQEGSIHFNGIPKKNLNLGQLRSLIGDCLTQEQLFHGTLMENICMGKEKANFENVKWAVENLGLDQFISNLNDGYETMLDPEGKRLPRSIVQKLLLARCVVDRPKLIVLEDPLEHIDEHEKHKIIDFLTAPENQWTMIVVSSDPYFAQKCDRVALMADGNIIETGSFDTMKKYI
jgi:ABC-type bacteriocin/lantibiotic exporter with double-glycine peptidase domain